MDPRNSGQEDIWCGRLSTRIAKSFSRRVVLTCCSTHNAGKRKARIHLIRRLEKEKERGGNDGEFALPGVRRESILFRRLRQEQSVSEGSASWPGVIQPQHYGFPLDSAPSLSPTLSKSFPSLQPFPLCSFSPCKRARPG